MGQILCQFDAGGGVSLKSILSSFWPALLMAPVCCMSRVEAAWSLAALRRVGRQKAGVRSWLKENVTLRRGSAWLHWDWSVLDAHKSVWFDISAATLKSPLHSDSSHSVTWSTVVFLIWVWMTPIIDKRWSACTPVMTMIFKAWLRTLWSFSSWFTN